MGKIKYSFGLLATGGEKVVFNTSDGVWPIAYWQGNGSLAKGVTER